MNIVQLNYFITLANERKFTTAATKLYITQPTLSQQIKQIENELGQDLFIRTHKDVSLTPAGKIFYEYAIEAIKQWELCKSKLNNISKDTSGNLSIGLFWTFGYNHIDELITKFEKAYPNISLHLSVDGSSLLVDKVISKQIDCAFITGCYLPEDKEFNFLKNHLNFTMLMESPLICIANENSKLANKKSLTFDDFDNEPIIYVSQVSNLYTVFHKCMSEANCKPKIIGYSSQADINMQVAKANIGYAFLTLDTYKNINHDGVKAIPLMPRINRQIYLISNKDNKNNSIELLRNVIV